jgi:hypothetical protein
MLSISIADQVQPFVEKQSTAAGFTTVNDYIHHLIMQEQTRLEQTEVDLTDPIALMPLPLAERRRVLEMQAADTVEHYEQDLGWREFTAGDLVEYS